MKQGREKTIVSSVLYCAQALCFYTLPLNLTITQRWVKIAILQMGETKWKQLDNGHLGPESVVSPFSLPSFTSTGGHFYQSCRGLEHINQILLEAEDMEDLRASLSGRIL